MKGKVVSGMGIMKDKLTDILSKEKNTPDSPSLESTPLYPKMLATKNELPLCIAHMAKPRTLIVAPRAALSKLRWHFAFPCLEGSSKLKLPFIIILEHLDYGGMPLGREK